MFIKSSIPESQFAFTKRAQRDMTKYEMYTLSLKIRFSFLNSAERFDQTHI